MSNGPGGRPTLYKPEFCDRLLEMGRMGYSKAEMAADFDVARFTLDRWAEEHEEFCDALTRARDLSLSVWEAKPRDQVLNDAGKVDPSYTKIMAARFPADYTERKDTKVEVSGAKGFIAVFDADEPGED